MSRSILTFFKKLSLSNLITYSHIYFPHLLGHFSFVGAGTYVIYSWDIVEPMVYFL